MVIQTVDFSLANKIVMTSDMVNIIIQTSNLIETADKLSEILQWAPIRSFTCANYYILIPITC